MCRLYKFVLLLTTIVGTWGSDSLIDCHPEPNASEDVCRTRNCTWKVPSVKGPPACYFPSDLSSMAGYDVTKLDNHPFYLTGRLKRRATPTLFGNDIEELMVQVDFLGENHLYIEITDVLNSRFKVPHPTVRRSIRKLRESRNFQNWNPSYDVKVLNSPFGITVTRRSTGTKLFDTANLPGFTFSDQFLQISTRLPSSNLYGFGEQSHDSLRHDLNWQKWGFFTRDDGPRPGDKSNLYGFHPFYLCLETDGSAHGVVLMNSHAMDVMLQPDPIVTFRPIGGLLELHIFTGPTPDAVIQQYTTLIGELSPKFGCITINRPALRLFFVFRKTNDATLLGSRLSIESVWLQKPHLFGRGLLSQSTTRNSTRCANG